MFLVSLLSHPYMVTLARWILAVVLLTSALSKLPNQHRFVFVVLTYRILPRRLARIYGMMLPWLEASVGILLLLGIVTRIGGILSALLLASFTIAVGLNVVRGRTDLDCGCLGSRHRHKISGKVLARNIVLMILSLDVMLFANGYLAIDSQFPAMKELGQQADIIKNLIIGVLSVAALFLLFPLLKQASVLRKSK